VPDDAVTLDVCGHTLRVTSPGRVVFPRAGHTKRDVVDYYLAVADAALVHLRERPCVLKRYPAGVESDPFFQKRVPLSHPWLETATVTFPSGRSATELVVNDAAHLVFAANLNVIDFNPWPVRRADLDHPDELRVDLDPSPGASFDDVRRVALSVRDVLAEHDLVGFVKTSGSRGIHINVRLVAEWGFDDVRRAALALAREVERRLPAIATSKWWKEERGERVFIDYNQNARDRTVASAYSIRPTADARVSCPIDWDEVVGVDPAALRLDTVPARLAARGDPAALIDQHPCRLDALLALAARDEQEGLGDAPWPPHFRKRGGEPPRAAPSRRRPPTSDD
jgi:bifunctional non-homologous end joining protein LigD